MHWGLGPKCPLPAGSSSDAGRGVPVRDSVSDARWAGREGTFSIWLTALVLESVGWHFSSEHLLCAGFVLRSGVTAVNKTDEDSTLRKSTS